MFAKEYVAKHGPRTIAGCDDDHLDEDAVWLESILSRNIELDKMYRKWQSLEEGDPRLQQISKLLEAALLKEGFWGSTELVNKSRELWRAQQQIEELQSIAATPPPTIVSQTQPAPTAAAVSPTEIAWYVFSWLIAAIVLLFLIVIVIGMFSELQRGVRASVTLVIRCTTQCLVLLVKAILFPVVIAREAFAIIRHAPNQADRQQLVELRPHNGDPFPNYPMPTFEEFCLACRRDIPTRWNDLYLWLRRPSEYAIYRRTTRAERRRGIVQSYKELADGDGELLGPWDNDSSMTLGGYCEEFVRLLTPQMIDAYCHCYLNDAVSTAQYERATLVLQEIIYRYAVHSISRGIYQRWSIKYPLIAENYSTDDFRTFLIRHMPVTRSSRTILFEYYRLWGLLAVAGGVGSETDSPEEVEKELDERQREESRRRYEMEESGKVRQHERDMKAAEIRLQRQIADTNRLIAATNAEDRLRRYQKDCDHIRSQSWDQLTIDKKLKQRTVQYETENARASNGVASRDSIATT